MTQTMNLDDYLAQGGVLTSPDNAPPRYRGELLRLMSSFVDSELAPRPGSPMRSTSPRRSRNASVPAASRWKRPIMPSACWR